MIPNRGRGGQRWQNTVVQDTRPFQYRRCGTNLSDSAPFPRQAEPFQHTNQSELPRQAARLRVWSTPPASESRVQTRPSHRPGSRAPARLDPGPSHTYVFRLQAQRRNGADSLLRTCKHLRVSAAGVAQRRVIAGPRARPARTRAQPPVPPQGERRAFTVQSPGPKASRHSPCGGTALALKACWHSGTGAFAA